MFYLQVEVDSTRKNERVFVMAFIMPDEGELWLLEEIQTAAILNGQNLRLFKNNITPSSISVIGDFTEADYSGYAGVTTVSFASATEVSNKAQITDAAARGFTHNGGGTANTVYGYYYESGSGKLILAEAFSSPVTMASFGDNVSVQLTVKLNGV